MQERDEYDEDWEPADGDVDDAPPYWFNGQHLPPHARAMGLTQHVPDGALLDFAGSLDSSKRGHKITAWAMLVVFGLPVVFAIMRLVSVIIPG